jgi:hypothetical protein
MSGTESNGRERTNPSVTSLARPGRRGPDREGPDGVLLPRLDVGCRLWVTGVAT